MYTHTQTHTSGDDGGASRPGIMAAVSLEFGGSKSRIYPGPQDSGMVVERGHSSSPTPWTFFLLTHTEILPWFWAPLAVPPQASPISRVHLRPKGERPLNSSLSLFPIVQLSQSHQYSGLYTSPFLLPRSQKAFTETQLYYFCYRLHSDIVAAQLFMKTGLNPTTCVVRVIHGELWGRIIGTSSESLPELFSLFSAVRLYSVRAGFYF